MQTRCTRNALKKLKKLYFKKVFFLKPLKKKKGTRATAEGRERAARHSSTAANMLTETTRDRDSGGTGQRDAKLTLFIMSKSKKGDATAVVMSAAAGVEFEK